MLPQMWLKGRWIYDQEYHAVFTYWQDEAIVLRITQRKRGRVVRVEIHARNEGAVPADYNEFHIEVHLAQQDLEGNATIDPTSLGVVRITASQTAYNFGIATVEVPAGTTHLALIWKNDEYVPATQQDANLMISNIILSD